MFRIINLTTGKEIGLTDKVNYIKVNPKTGCYIPAKKEEAIGIAFKGIAYNIANRTDIKDADSVMTVAIDGGSTLQDVKLKEHTLEAQLAETDEAAIELYEANLALEEANAEQDEAIIEIYEMMGEIING
jgi:hypothetical protein